MKPLSLLLLAVPLLTSPAAAQISQGLRSNLEAESPPAGAEVGLALIDLASGDSLWINARWRVHAASTMKVPVLIELAQRVDAGGFGWDWPLLVKNEFHSIVDGSTFALLIPDDSEKTLFAREGELVPARELARLMITWSSNFATNLLVDQLGAPRIQATARRLGADSIVVLRGVEDQKAFDRGLSNTTTARDLAVLLASIAQGQAASDSSTAIMLDILTHQVFRDGIPAGVPPGTRIASKTGGITGINHDAAVIYPPGRPPYVLVILTRGFERPADAEAYMAKISAEVWASLVGP
ncbi:MAG TPA: class A beta-lactamase-related serine hydrolase [Gemmatimonadales bacterium]|nr:class A beta-lactamase-related serine hydrolase [Gemmatimonadales bacterium]